jgi:hypothetical protein
MTLNLSARKKPRQSPMASKTMEQATYGVLSQTLSTEGSPERQLEALAGTHMVAKSTILMTLSC